MKPKYENPFGRMRSNTKKNGRTFPLVSTAIMPEDASFEEFEATLHEKFKGIRGHQSQVEFGPEANTPQHRPQFVLSPNSKTVYKRSKDYGWILMYSEDADTEVSRQNLKEDPEIEKILKSPCVSKEQTFVITEDLLDAMTKKRKKYPRNSSGIPDQNRTLKRKRVDKQQASATKIAERLGVRHPKEIWEWLHLIAFMFKHVEAQKKENLTGGTAHANTDMIYAEDEVVYLTYALKKEVRLLVKASEFTGTHFAKEIRFTILIEGLAPLHFVFDAQTSVQPDYRNKSYIHAVVATIVETALKLPSKNSKNVCRQLFYPDEAATPQENKAQKPPLPKFFFQPKTIPPDQNQLPLKKEAQEEVSEQLLQFTFDEAVLPADENQLPLKKAKVERRALQNASSQANAVPSDEDRQSRKKRKFEEIDCTLLRSKFFLEQEIPTTPPGNSRNKEEEETTFMPMK
jgi:hypothetical protein